MPSEQIGKDRQEQEDGNDLTAPIVRQRAYSKDLVGREALLRQYGDEEPRGRIINIKA